MKKFIEWHNRIMDQIWAKATSPATKEPSVLDSFLPRTKETESFHKVGDKLAAFKNWVNFWTKKFIIWTLVAWTAMSLLYFLSKIF